MREVRKTRAAGLAIRRRGLVEKLAKVRAAVTAARRDFDAVGMLTVPVDVTDAGRYAGNRVVKVEVDSREHLLREEDHADLVVEIVRLLQAVAVNSRTHWPTIPLFGPLHPEVRSGRPVWVLSNGEEFCEVGFIFAP